MRNKVNHENIGFLPGMEPPKHTQKLELDSEDKPKELKDTGLSEQHRNSRDRFEKGAPRDID